MNAALQTTHTLADSSTAAVGWTDISRKDLSGWDEALLRTDAALYQYPYWNEPFRRSYFTPRYLVWPAGHAPSVYACILTLGPPGLRVGLVLRGPASLLPEQAPPTTALEQLASWAKSKGYVFLRFTHSEKELLDRIASVGTSHCVDGFPFYQDFPVASHDLVVEQLEDDDRMLASFDREARRKIKRATEVGYEFRSEGSPEALVKVWHLFVDCAQRKQFRIDRPLSAYLDLVRLAGKHDCVRVYSSWLNGRPVGTTLVFRDRTTALCLLAGFAPDAMRGPSSPAVLLHWQSMRDMYRLGALHYNMGPGPGTVGQFKQQFSPVKVVYPPPLTLVLNQPLFRGWSALVLPYWKTLRPIVRATVSKLHR